MMYRLRKKFMPVVALFVLLTGLILIFKPFLIQNGFNVNFLLVANLVLGLLSFYGFFIQTKGVTSPNINAFIRGVYSSILLKIFVVVIAIVIYIYITGGKVNKPSLFTSMVFYLLYTSIEVIQLMKIARQKPNA